jgi:hypothetical protein
VVYQGHLTALDMDLLPGAEQDVKDESVWRGEKVSTTKLVASTFRADCSVVCITKGYQRHEMQMNWLVCVYIQNLMSND